MVNTLKKNKLLIVFVLYAALKRRDFIILEKEYKVKPYRFNTTSKYFLPFAFLKQFIFLLFNIYKYKAVIVQSSGYLFFLPILFGKLFNMPIVIIAIGTDCAKLPENNYGSRDKKIIAWFTRHSFMRANLILSVHKSLEESTYTYSNVKFPRQGIRAYCSTIQTKIIEMVNSYDTIKWKLLELDCETYSFLTVTFAINEVGYYRIGIDVIVEADKAFSNYEFTKVGKVFMKEACSANIRLVNNVTQEKLLEIYTSHKYYMQLSMFEGFPNALCEAMLCGCIPNSIDVAAIPDMIGNQGYILKTKDEAAILGLYGNLNGRFSPISVRDRIADNFSLERKSSEFLNHIKSLKHK